MTLLVTRLIKYEKFDFSTSLIKTDQYFNKVKVSSPNFAFNIKQIYI